MSNNRDFHPTPIDDLSFEQAFNELEQIVQNLENTANPLESTILLYERGQLLARHCANLLDHAELKIKLLNGEDLTDFSISG